MIGAKQMFLVLGATALAFWHFRRMQSQMGAVDKARAEQLQVAKNLITRQLDMFTHTILEGKDARGEPRLVVVRRATTLLEAHARVEKAAAARAAAARGGAKGATKAANADPAHHANAVAEQGSLDGAAGDPGAGDGNLTLPAAPVVVAELLVDPRLEARGPNRGRGRQHGRRARQQQQAGRGRRSGRSRQGRAASRKGRGRRGRAARSQGGWFGGGGSRYDVSPPTDFVLIAYDAEVDAKLRPSLEHFRVIEVAGRGGGGRGGGRRGDLPRGNPQGRVARTQAKRRAEERERQRKAAAMLLEERRRAAEEKEKEKAGGEGGGAAEPEPEANADVDSAGGGGERQAAAADAARDEL